MFKLGMIHMTNGDFDNALTIFKRIISQLQKNRATSGYAAEAKMLNNIGVLLYEMGKDGDADASLLKAFDIQKSIFKQSQCPSAERVAANILGNLGFIYAKQGKYSDALQVFTETLEVLKKYVPLDHPLIVTVEENVAMVKAYGAEEPEDRRRHAQSNPFACVQTDFVKPKQQPLAQSKVTACVGLQ